MLYRKSTLAVLLALIFFSFFGTLTASAWMFPKNYDWRYRVISNLLSPRDNPNHYWLAASGVALTGLLMLPFVRLLRRHLEVIAPRSAKLSAATFTAGIIALICACLVVPQHTHDVLGVRRLHELLGRFRRRFSGNGNVMQLLVRVERPRTKPVCSAIVLDLVISDAVAAGWNFL